MVSSGELTEESYLKTIETQVATREELALIRQLERLKIKRRATSDERRKTQIAMIQNLLEQAKASNGLVVLDSELVSQLKKEEEMSALLKVYPEQFVILSISEGSENLETRILGYESRGVSNVTFILLEKHQGAVNWQQDKKNRYLFIMPDGTILDMKSIRPVAEDREPTPQRRHPRFDDLSQPQRAFDISA